MPHINPKILGWSLYYLFLACLLTSNSFGYLDPDFGWHLRFGEIIAETKAVPYDQIFMWPLTGINWVDHEWLANLTTYALFAGGGYATVSIFFIILPLLSFGLLNFYIFRNYLKTNKEQVTFALIQIAALIGCLPHFGVRMQEFSFLFFIIFLIIIDQVRRSKITTHAVWLIPLLFIWSCLHGAYLIGAALIIGWLVYEALLFFLPRLSRRLKEQVLSKQDLIRVTIIIIVALLATCATPYGFQLYSFLADYGSNRYYLSHIEEWRSPYLPPFEPRQILYSISLVVLSIASWIFSKRFLKLWQLIIVIALLAAASRSVRHFPLWAAASLIFILPLIIKGSLETLKIPYARALQYLSFACLLGLSILLLCGARFTTKPFVDYCSRYPCGAMSFLDKHPQYDSLKLFNEYGWGGYLIGINSKQRPFIDGRLPQYPFKGHTVLEEYSLFFKRETLTEKLSEYDIELILYKSSLKPYNPNFFERHILGRKKHERTSVLLEYVKTNDRWTEIYRDDTSILYVRTDKK